LFRAEEYFFYKFSFEMKYITFFLLTVNLCVFNSMSVAGCVRLSGELGDAPEWQQVCFSISLILYYFPKVFYFSFKLKEMGDRIVWNDFVNLHEWMRN